MARPDAILQPVYFCDAVRTPFGRYGGALAGVRTDDLAAEPLRALQARIPPWTGARSTT
jgi:acetyl-CoA acetyltransferase